MRYCQNKNKYDCEKIEKLITCDVDVVRETFLKIKLRSSVGCCMQLLMRNGSTFVVIS